MTRSLPTLALALTLAAPVPALAEEERGMTLMERGAQLFFRGLMDEMEPALDGLRDMAGELEPALRSFAEEMGPALAQILRDVKDFSAYHPPVMLPNGDIIMRRKEPLEPTPDPLEKAPGKEIEL